MKTSNKLKNWMNHFYHYSSDKENIRNKESKLGEEFTELREIIKEIRRLEQNGN